jgi:hypothetical protein
MSIESKKMKTIQEGRRMRSSYNDFYQVLLTFLQQHLQN